MENPPVISNPQNESKFNLGLSTLEEIHEILKEIRKITINVKDITTMQPIMTHGKAQHMKYRLTKQLLVRASPLLKDVVLKELNTTICKMKIGWKRNYAASDPFMIDSTSPVTPDCIEIYYPSTEIELDNFIIEIQLKMQEKGKSFMPTKGESGLF